jgi:hypothetical protein
MAREANGKAGAAVSISENVNRGRGNTGGVTFESLGNNLVKDSAKGCSPLPRRP